MNTEHAKQTDFKNLNDTHLRKCEMTIIASCHEGFENLRDDLIEVKNE